MIIAELKRMLDKYPDSTAVVFSSDAEGNETSHSPLVITFGDCIQISPR